MGGVGGWGRDVGGGDDGDSGRGGGLTRRRRRRVWGSGKGGSCDGGSIEGDCGAVGVADAAGDKAFEGSDDPGSCWESGVNKRCSCRGFGSEGRVGGCRVAEVLGESKCGCCLLVSGGGEQVIASRGSCAARAVGDRELRNSGEGDGGRGSEHGVGGNDSGDEGCEGLDAGG